MQASLPLPPRAPGTWLLGNFSEFNRDKLATVTRYARTHGDVVAVRFGPLRSVIVSDPALVEQVLVTRAKEFTKGWVEQLIRPSVGNGIFLSEGDYWKRQRRMVSPPFHKQRLTNYGDVMVRTAERVVADWRDGEVRDVYPSMTKIGLAVAAKTMFDVDVDQDADGLGVALTTMMRAVTTRIDARLPLPDFIPTPNMLRLKRANRELDTILYRAINERRARKELGEDLLSLLLAARDEDDGSGMSDVQLRNEAMTLFIAGFETTAIALSWIAYLLSTHPDVDARLHAEVRAAIGERAATADDLPKLKYVERVVNEALRLYPPAWAMDRLANADLELGGFRIKRGTDIWLSPWVMHRDPRFWTEPERFDPDRWDGDLQKRLPKFAFYPFGGGPRVCIGNAFAMMEATLVTATIAQRFRFASSGAPAPTPEPGFTLRPAPGVTVRVDRRVARAATAA
jgi:cytochrome P450